MSEGSEPDALSEDLLPYRPRPFPDELFSSWLFRLAHGHGLRLRDFCRLAFGQRPWISVCDIDRKADAKLLSAISLKTAIPCDRLFRATLRSYEGALFEKMTRSGTVKWILPIGVNRDYGERFGFQFCPRCLSSDRDPYNRRHWRLAFVTACPLHRCLLLDRCPHCGAPVNPVRSEIALPFDRLDETLVRCFRCEEDLRTTGERIRASLRFIIRQKSLIRLAEGGCGRVFGVDFNYAHLFFDVFFRILQMLLSPETGMLGESVRKLSQIPFTVKPLLGKNRFRFVVQGVRERHETLDAGFWIFTGWPSNFLKVCHVGRIPKVVREIWSFRFMADLPLRDADDALLANWFELTVTDEETGKVLYHNAWITDHPITEDTLVTLAKAGRARWKIENEHIQTLKIGGYRLDHNFGHGKRHLSNLLASMNILAFLVHTAFEFLDDRYRTLRFRYGSRAVFFQRFATLLEWALFDNWDHVIAVMFAKLRVDTG